ncbi:ATP-binding cassette sub-family B member mitochondrial [Brachionus plicatilis]|uniref:ATP-binding cassette sub-family B member mitochondrial n=1 Tax=Brachionus plicatilis TaxID=10195 RepID=A0A3M7P5I7_BRAPC|nr:ATP-binding cassette sub-family B member mitochondrial [Brachionus plicatilis]
MFCPSNSSVFINTWTNEGFSLCFFDSIFYTISFGFILLFGSIQISFYVKFSNNIDKEYLSKNFLFKLQYLLHFLLMLEAFIKFSIETTIIEKNKFYGYLILNCVTKSISWILAIVLVFFESCKALPSIPSRGHGLVLLIFWTLQLIIENFAFISYKGDEWFWKLDSKADKIRFSLWCFRFSATLICFLIGFRAPGVPKRRYGLMIESQEVESFSQKLIKRLRLSFSYIWKTESMMTKACFFICLLIVLSLRVTSVMVSIFSKILINQMIDIRNNNTDGFETSGNIVFDEPFKFPLLLLATLTVLQFLDGKLIQNGFLNNLRSFLWLQVKQSIKKLASKNIYFNVQKLSYNLHSQNEPKEFYNLINDGSESISNFLSCLLFDLMPMLLDILIAIVYFMFLFNMWFSILIFLSLSIYLTITIYISERRAKLNEVLNERKNNLEKKTLEALANVKFVKLNATEYHETEKFTKLGEQCQIAETTTLKSLWFLNLLQNMVMNVSLLVGSIYCSWLITTEEALSIGDFVLFASFLLRLYSDLSSLGSYYKSIKKSFYDMEIALNYTDYYLLKSRNLKNFEYQNGILRFEGVSFDNFAGNPGDAINFSIEPDQKVGLTGCTSHEIEKIEEVMLKLNSYFSGMIKYDNQDVRSLEEESLRRLIGLLDLNDIKLFHNETFEFNLVYGKLGYLHYSDLEKIVEFADLKQKLASMEDGFKTIISKKDNFFTQEDLIKRTHFLVDNDMGLIFIRI